eukprot:7263443-Lingulodinium_polyedra.AAC.1
MGLTVASKSGIFTNPPALARDIAGDLALRGILIETPGVVADLGIERGPARQRLRPKHRGRISKALKRMRKAA